MEVAWQETEKSDVLSSLNSEFGVDIRLDEDPTEVDSVPEPAEETCADIQAQPEAVRAHCQVNEPPPPRHTAIQASHTLSSSLSFSLSRSRR